MAKKTATGKNNNGFKVAGLEDWGNDMKTQFQADQEKEKKNNTSNNIEKVVLSFRVAKSVFDRYNKIIAYWKFQYLSREQANIIYIMNVVLEKFKTHIEKKYGKIEQPTDNQIDFYKSNSKGKKILIPNIDLSELQYCAIWLKPEDKELYILLMHNYYVKEVLEKYPDNERYSIAIFFHTIVDFMEKYKDKIIK